MYLSRIWKTADFDLWKTVSEDTASAACKTLNIVPYEHSPNSAIQSHRNISFPKICGEATEKMHELSKWNNRSGWGQLSETNKNHTVLNRASSSTHQLTTQMERGGNREGLKQHQDSRCQQKQEQLTISKCKTGAQPCVGRWRSILAPYFSILLKSQHWPRTKTVTRKSQNEDSTSTVL